MSKAASKIQTFIFFILIIKIRKQKEDQEKTQNAIQKQASKMKAIFMSAQDEKQIQRIKSLSQEEFDKEMAKWMDE